MTNWVLAATLVIICGASVLTSCSNDNAPAGQQDEYEGVPLVIYDTDIGSSTDDLFALEMLYRYEDEGRCRCTTRRQCFASSKLSKGNDCTSYCWNPISTVVQPVSRFTFSYRPACRSARM